MRLWMISGRLTISRIAKLSGVSVETIRYYQRKGILSTPHKGLTSYREYSPETVNRIRFIKRTLELGFTLNEITELLGFWSAKQRSCDQVKDRAERKIREVNSKIDDLSRIRSALEKVSTVCSQRRTLPE